MTRIASRLRTKHNYTELAVLIPKIEIMVENLEVTNILVITSYDQYANLYNNRNTRHLPINLIRLNSFRSGSKFVEAYAKAMRDVLDGTLVVIDDVRDFLQQGRMYAPGRLEQCLHLLQYYKSDIFKLFGGSEKYVAELESLLLK